MDVLIGKEGNIMKKSRKKKTIDWVTVLGFIVVLTMALAIIGLLFSAPHHLKP